MTQTAPPSDHYAPARSVKDNASITLGGLLDQAVQLEIDRAARARRADRFLDRRARAIKAGVRSVGMRLISIGQPDQLKSVRAAAVAMGSADQRARRAEIIDLCWHGVGIKTGSFT